MTTLEIPQAEQKGDLLSAIGDTLRAERTEKGLTLKQVAEGAHVSVSYLAEIERGEKDPSSKVLESIARGLDVEISDLLIRIASSSSPRRSSSPTPWLRKGRSCKGASRSAPPTRPPRGETPTQPG